MFSSINIKPNSYNTLSLFDKHDIIINRDDRDNVELVIHPCTTGRVTIRFAKEPYTCKIHLANGEVRNIDLSDEEDWGEIQQMNCDHGEVFKEGVGVIPLDWDKRIGWGNDEDGHIEITKVELNDSIPVGTEIPLEEFWQDVGDFITNKPRKRSHL